MLLHAAAQQQLGLLLAACHIVVTSKFENCLCVCVLSVVSNQPNGIISHHRHHRHDSARTHSGRDLLLFAVLEPKKNRNCKPHTLSSSSGLFWVRARERGVLVVGPTSLSRPHHPPAGYPSFLIGQLQFHPI